MVTLFRLFGAISPQLWSFHSVFQSCLLKNTSSQASSADQMQGGKDSHFERVMPGGSNVSKDVSDPNHKKWSPWAEALRKLAMQPEGHGDTILQVTQEAVVLADKFPKGRKHLLVVSRQDGLDSLEDLNRSHIPLLKNLQALGVARVQIFLEEDQSLVFRLGYHSEPSMRQLHMHVISQDFDSPSLKNKKHWNSFTTTFFLDSKAVIEELEATGRVKPCGDENSLLKLDMRCHKCLYVQPNIPRLKQHIQTCKAPFPLDLVQKGYLFRKI
ncbi:hypothetical protein L7F22_064488 [Adiantum nelumboides]|nr:hypothetical protein [Adiantum nelumboides]